MTKQPGIPPGWKKPSSWEEAGTEIMVAWPTHWKPAVLLKNHMAELENGGQIRVSIRDIICRRSSSPLRGRTPSNERGNY